MVSVKTKRRVCAIDLGKVRVGVAVSDELGLMAHPRPALDGTNRKPLLGVCYGHQALAAAFGAWVRRDLASHLGEETVRIAAGGGIFSGFPASFPMHESHEEIVVRDPALKRNFALLAESGSGLVEAIAHRERPLFGVQFHPERSGELGVRLLANFLRIAQHEAANYRDA